MNALSWVLQIVLAAVFLAHGVMLLVPPPEVARLMNETLPRWFQIFLGTAEVAAAFGVTVPGWTRIQPSLVPAAAIGLMIVMASATVLHIARAENGSAVVTALLFAMATAVAYLRWRIVPTRPRALPA